MSIRRHPELYFDDVDGGADAVRLQLKKIRQTYSAKRCLIWQRLLEMIATWVFFPDAQASIDADEAGCKQQFVLCGTVTHASHHRRRHPCNAPLQWLGLTIFARSEWCPQLCRLLLIRRLRTGSLIYNVCKHVMSKFMARDLDWNWEMVLSIFFASILSLSDLARFSYCFGRFNEMIVLRWRSWRHEKYETGIQIRVINLTPEELSACGVARIEWRKPN